MTKVKLKVEGMHCSSCASDIDLDLEEIKGVKSSKTHFAKQIMEVEFDEDHISLGKIIDMISKKGYKAVLHE